MPQRRSPMHRLETRRNTLAGSGQTGDLCSRCGFQRCQNIFNLRTTAVAGLRDRCRFAASEPAIPRDREWPEGRFRRYRLNLRSQRLRVRGIRAPSYQRVLALAG